jgi:hypothetical protein
MAELILEDDEKEKLRIWKAAHYTVCKLEPGTCGDLYHFRICPSGIGNFISVKCPCGASEDLTGDL